MKKTLLAIVVCAPLAACVTSADVENKISEVQGYTRLACSYLPTVATIAKIIAAGGAVDSAAAIGGAICNAVTTAPLADGPGDRIPRVNGVVIRGAFIK